MYLSKHVLQCHKLDKAQTAGNTAAVTVHKLELCLNEDISDTKFLTSNFMSKQNKYYSEESRK